MKIIKITSLIVVLIIFGYLIFEMSLSNATKYCPLAHRLNSDMSCRICDRLNDKMLIEHFNIDTNELTMSINEKGKVTWMRHPYNYVSNFNTKIEMNKILFDTVNTDSLIVNDIKYPIKKL